MTKNCENCLYCDYNMEEETHYCLKYDCFCNEVVKEKEKPSCWEDIKEKTNKEIYGDN